MTSRIKGLANRSSVISAQNENIANVLTNQITIDKMLALEHLAAGCMITVSGGLILVKQPPTRNPGKIHQAQVNT